MIAATNRNLREEVNAHRFRSDLYYRLAVVPITLPPLRERREDLPALIEALLADLGTTGTAASALRSGELVPELLRHAWPGNVRELRNYLEAALVRQDFHRAADADVDEDRTSPLAIDLGQPLRVVRERWVRELERRYLEQLLAAHSNNVSAAARAAGVDRVHLHRLLGRAGLR